MSERSNVAHRALIVEDDAETAEDLSEIVGSLGWDHVVAASREEAGDVLRAQQVCVVLLDLQIKETARSIKGHVQHGRALLRDLRQDHGAIVGQKFWLPVVVVSGYAREVPTVVEVMKDGASDLIQKPLNSNEVSRTLRTALKESGRASHAACLAGIVPAGPNADEDVEISIPGERVRRRTVVMVGHTRLEITDSSLRVLLRLLVGHGEGRVVHKTDLGASDEQGFKGVSALRAEVKPALGHGVNIIKNLYHGNYCLSSQVRIGPCAVADLEAIGDREISELARRLESQSHQPKKRV